MTPNFLAEKIGRPILNILRHGITPEKMALSLALGLMVGIFPLMGATTFLCIFFAAVLRLNLPSILIANYVVYPLQFALMIPFFRLGSKVFGIRLAFSSAQMHALVHTGARNLIRTLWTTEWHAMVAWSLLAPVIVAIVYSVLVPILRRVLHNDAASAEAAQSLQTDKL